MQGGARQSPGLGLQYTHAAAHRLERTGQRVEQRGFTRTRRANDGQHLTRHHLQIHILHGDNLGAIHHSSRRVANAEILQRHSGCKAAAAEILQRHHGLRGHPAYFSRPAFSPAALMPL